MEGEGKWVAHAQSGLLPNAVVGGGTGPGCFTHLKGIATTTGQLWWWEVIMTFLLVSVSPTPPALDCTLGFPDEAYLNYILHGESYDASRAAPDI